MYTVYTLKVPQTYIYIYWLVVSTPLKNMSSSIGMMKFPTEWKNKKSSKPPTSVCWFINHYKPH